MLTSMTGFGRSEKNVGGTNILVELRSVNSRFLELITRFPRGFETVEDQARLFLQGKIPRGRITLTMTFGSENSIQGTPRLNSDLLEKYRSIFDEAKTIVGSDNPTPLCELLRMPDVISYDSDSSTDDLINSKIMDAVREAGEQMLAMRRREGELLGNALTAQLKNLNVLIRKIREGDKGRFQAIAEKLRKRIEELQYENHVNADTLRLEQELVLWGDRLDITEELVRLDAHIQHFQELMKEDGDAGKRLNFLLQEMNREANTIGSKANSTPIAHAVVEMKDEIEKIREQVQNIQ